MKIFRRFLAIIFLIIVITGAGLFALFYISVNSNQVKSQIAEQVYAQTGLQLQIKGSAGWLVSKDLCIRFSKVQLKRRFLGDNDVFAKSPQVDVFVAWRPLLSRQIKIQKLQFHPLSLVFRPNFSKKTIKMTVKGNLTLNLVTQQISLTNLVIDSGDIHATGSLSGEKILQFPELRGRLKFTQLNLASILPFFMVTNDLQGDLKNVEIHFNFSPGEWISGDISAKQLTFNHYKIKHLQAKFSGGPAQIQFVIIRGELAGGPMIGRLQIMHWKDDPHYQLSADINHAEISELLGSDILMGPAQLSAHLTSAGSMQAQRLSHLNGDIRLVMVDGWLNHIDLLKQIHDVRQFLLVRSEAHSTGKTHFSALSASGKIKDGIFENDDFILQSSGLEAAGKGSVNLLSRQIHYTFWVKAFGLSVPVNITGTLSKPKTKIDLKSLSIPIKKTLHNEIKVLFGNHPSQ